jgi:hypothetical protein
VNLHLASINPVNGIAVIAPRVAEILLMRSPKTLRVCVYYCRSPAGPITFFGALVFCVRCNVVIHRSINQFKEMTPATLGVIAQVALALPYSEPL